MNLGKRKWAGLAVLGLLLLAGSVRLAASSDSASKFYKQGQAAEAKDDVMGAYDLYAKAYQKDPKDMRYRAAYLRMRYTAGSEHVHRGEKLRDQGDDTGAMTEFLRALEIDPSNELAQQDIEAMRQRVSPAAAGQETSLAQQAGQDLSGIASPVTLKPLSEEPLTLHMVEDAKVVYQAVGKTAGINVLFDPDYNSKRIQVDLTNVSLSDALRIIGAISGTFWRPVTENTIFVAQNSRTKRTELDEQAVQTFYLANAAQQNDLNDIQTAVRNVLTGAKLYGVPSQNAIVVRGTPDELLLAQKLISDLDRARPEVVVDIAVLEVSRDKIRNMGIQLPQSGSVALQSSTSSSSTNNGTGGTTGGTTTNSPSGLTLNTLAHLNANNFAVTVGQAQANLILTDSDTKVIQNPRMRASDGQEATLKIGSRIPEATGSYSTGTTSLTGLGVQTQFQYIDVGVNIKLKPTVHYDRDVTLKLSIEVSSVSGYQNISGVNEPVISQKTIEQVIRLKEGEANILGGILQKTDTKTISGTPGLGEIPLLKYLFSTQDHEVNDDEVIFLMIPHIVRGSQISPLNLRQIDTGTGTNVELRHLQADASTPPAAATPATASTVRPPSPAAGGPITGQSAAVAANNAVSTMKQATERALGPPAQTAPPPQVRTVTPPATAPAAASVPAVPALLQLVPPDSTQKVGASFEITINMSGAQDVFSVPMQLLYDSSKLQLTNVDTGDFLGHDGQAVALVHRDDGNGGVAISASRPPGVAGVSGSGKVCVLTFQAKAAGDAAVVIQRPGARNSAQQLLPVQGSQAIVHVQ